ncbi:MAG: acetylornithine/succinyldiaminopimelate transaminase [Saccharospirillaceae bacterium]|nr:acetylornithine/succinyldiaminopimelate transaminase [Pseudomonadales bacterium]NRB77972.1 acetylornithine/succinyldiaminopimelate transaminase [Saccharospirillaceae bacterium]
MISRAQFDQIMVPNYAPGNVVPVKGKGSLVWDQEGNEYLDLSSGISVNALGHANPILVKAIQEQSEKLWHVSNILTNEPALELATKLCDLTFAEKVFFCNSGAEANEAALKLARRYAFDHYNEDKYEIISTINSFHGRTLFTVNVGGQPSYTQGFGPKPGGISHVPYNNLQAMEEAISEKTCAIIIEPLQGEGGVMPADADYLAGLRHLCDKHNALLIFDEVQTGVGRTGSFYAYQGFGVVPDILTSAKALGGGFPIGAMLTTTKVAESFSVGTHGSTYGGNPLACAVSLATVNEISKTEFLESVIKKGHAFQDFLNKMNEKFGLFEEVRGLGLLIGAPLKGEYIDRAGELMAKALEQNLMILIAGKNVLRFAPSLNITDAELKLAFEKIEATFESFCAASI